MKKLLTLITAAILAASALTATASAATVTMYAEDGRTITVQDYEVSAYRNVGWYTEPFVTMYALDGRSIKVQQSQVPAYQNVGWYTEGDMYWKKYVEPDLQDMYNRNDYVSLYLSADQRLINDPYSPIYTDALYAYRTRAMDKWRIATGCPLGVTAHESELVQHNNDGSMSSEFAFTNTSYKNIIAFKHEYDICDVFGNVLYKYVANAGNTPDNRINIAPGETYYNMSVTIDKYDVTRYNLRNSTFIRNSKIAEVVFADGTKWVNPGHYISNGTLSNVYLAGYTFKSNNAPYYISLWIF
ncbi:MAG: hypothetical protein E7583_06835 [Ruminococcaceae bacterium]|nr:hypothetical protein [Oscillospiraceae bacterium]